MSRLLEHYAEPMLGPAGFLATVVNVNDPDRLHRVQVRVFGTDGVADQDGPLWARVAVPFAGGKRGAFFIPDVGDEVLVVFLSGDARFPVIVGSLWNGKDDAPDNLGGDGSSVDRWTITGKAGTRIAIVEETQPQIMLTTPAGLRATMDDASNSIKLEDASNNSITLDPSGISIQSLAQVTVNASNVTVTAAKVTVSAALSVFDGMVQCQVLQTPSVVATTYTPGAGNVW